MADLSDILSMEFGDVPQTKQLTEGIYDFTVKRYFDKSYENKEGGTNVIMTFVLTPEAVVDSEDFDESELELAEDIRVDFFLTKNALAVRSPNISMRAFIQHVLDLSDSEVNGMNVATATEMLIGQRTRAAIHQKMEGKNKDIPTMRVAKFLNLS